MNLFAKTTLILTASIAMLGAAQAGPMQNAREHVEKAITALKDRATDDKGGHKVNAIKLLKSALAEIDAGVAFDQANKTKNEGKKN